MSKRNGLVAASVLLVVFMMWFVPWATQTLGPAMGYATVFLVYWFGFCLPLGLFFQGRFAQFAVWYGRSTLGATGHRLSGCGDGRRELCPVVLCGYLQFSKQFLKFWAAIDCGLVSGL